ncbi:HlyC/CorC family transporter [bacterium]|nr:HlyC/CorC family transporter [bacterium]MBO5446527.1 HlyC/CorC family transporter [bacterium]
MSESSLGIIISNWLIVFVLLLVNGFFVAAEFAIVKARRTKIEQLTKDGNVDAKLALRALEDMNYFIAAVQLGITIASIGIGWFGSPTVEKMLAPVLANLPAGYGHLAHIITAVVAFFTVTLLHVVVGEQVPKCVALQYPEKISLYVAKPMDLFMTIARPFVWLLNVSCNIILKIFKVPTSSARVVHTLEDLDLMVDASFDEGVLNETEKDMIHNVFQFSDLTAREVMIPRTDMICVPNDMSFEDLNKLAAENQYTRYPVYDGDIDHITGLVHVKDLYSLALKDEVRTVQDLQRNIMLVPETMTMDNLVREFKKNKGQMAIVVDEFGGTSGIITLEDVMEEIFGDVQDEFDEEAEFDIKEIKPNHYLANGMMRLDELANFFDVPDEKLEDDDVDTIAGLVVKELGRLAQLDDVVKYHEFTFTVKEIDGARITKLLIVREESQVEEVVAE